MTTAYGGHWPSTLPPGEARTDAGSVNMIARTWLPIPVPGICERMIGFSVPRDGRVLVVSHEGGHVVRLCPPALVATDQDQHDHDDFDHGTGICRYGGHDWNIIGLHPGRPLLTSPAGEWLELDSDAKTISVFLGTDEVWSSTFGNFSGDWAAATFSPDGRFIVLGCPYDFDFRVWQRAPDVDDQPLAPRL